MPSTRYNYAYFFMVLVSGLIAVYDNVLSMIFSEWLPEMEQNPVASYIIEYAGVPLLVQWKAFGTLAAVLLMFGLVKTKYRISIVLVFICQLVLFYYLTFFTHTNFASEDAFATIRYVIEFYRGTMLWSEGCG